jgi:flavin-dependent dehydrogenase
VLLLDKARFPRSKPCSEYTSPAALAVLDALGARAAYEAEGPARLQGMDILSPQGRRLRIEYLPGGDRRHALAMARERLDALLLHHARGLGTEVREGARVRRLVLEGADVRGVVVAGPDGDEAPIRARLVVGADGLHGVVARDVGVRRPMRWPRRLGLTAHYEGVEGLLGRGEMHVGRWGYAGLAPLPHGLTSVGLALDLRRWRPSRTPRAELYREALRLFPALAGRLRGARLSGTVHGVGPIAVRTTRTQGPGWALAGDAAGFTDPFTGEGIYRALRSGELLAEIASRALRTGGDLADYEVARSGAFRHKSLLVLAIQAIVSYPALLEYGALRAEDRPNERLLLAAALGDCVDARRALLPGFLLRALRP